VKRNDPETAKRLHRCAAAPLFFVLALFLIDACAGGKPALYREDGSPLSIVEYEKLAQKERDVNRYENAIKAYEAIVRYYGENASAVLWATYETGFCYFKLERYADAEGYFRKIVDEFQDPAAKKLSQDMLTRIVDKANKKKKR
jgi:tetratricopeptide (TPR) repeat protein